MFRLLSFCLLVCMALTVPDDGYGHAVNHHDVHDAHGGVSYGHGNAYHHGGGGTGYKAHGYHAPAKYSFGYGIKDSYHGTNFGHTESRDGYRTSGSYYVNLPDGRIQKVTYYADEHGYHPTVTYEGKAHFPSHHKGHQGGYQ